MDLFSQVVHDFSVLPNMESWPAAQTLFQRASSRKPNHWLLPVRACEAVGGAQDQALPAMLAVGCAHVGILLVDDMLDADPRGAYHPLGMPEVSNLACAFQAAALRAIGQCSQDPASSLVALTSFNAMFLSTAFGQFLDASTHAPVTGHAVPWCADPAEFLHIDVHQLASMPPLVAVRWLWWRESRQAVEAQAGEHCGHCRECHPQPYSDLRTSHAYPAQLLHHGHARGCCAVRNGTRHRGTVDQARGTFMPIAAKPLPRGAATHPSRGRGRYYGPALDRHPLAEQQAAMQRQAGVSMGLHRVSLVAERLGQPSVSKEPRSEQPA